MSRKLTACLFLIFLLPNTIALGQLDPSGYRSIVKELSTLTPSDAKYPMVQGYVRRHENDFRRLFRDMPPVALMALSFGTQRLPFRSDWITKMELELRRSSIRVKKATRKSTFPQLIIGASRAKTGQWLATLKLNEEVTLLRPVRDTIVCTTYESNSPYRKTQAEAEKDMWDSLDEFCLLYMKFSKP
jgi:hypothetical protein